MGAAARVAKSRGRSDLLIVESSVPQCSEMANC